MANLANRGAKAPTSVSDQQDSQKGLQVAVRECQETSGCVTPVAACVAAYTKITPAATGSKPSGHRVFWSAVATERSAQERSAP